MRLDDSSFQVGRLRTRSGRNSCSGPFRFCSRLIVAAFTLREIARRAGVSHNAPYRHFRDKDALLAAVAAQGFRELTRAMRVPGERPSKALDKLKQSGLAYVAFAVRRLEHFTVKFDAPVSASKDPEYTQASQEAFNTLVNYIPELSRRRPPARRKHSRGVRRKQQRNQMALPLRSSNNFLYSGKCRCHFRRSAQAKLGPRCPPFAYQN